jgi:chalcone isomerase
MVVNAAACKVCRFVDVCVSGGFEKFARVTMIRPLTGEQYAGKVADNCVAYWKAAGLYTDAEGVAVEKFKQVFKPQTFPPGASIHFTHSPAGVLTVSSIHFRATK